MADKSFRSGNIGDSEPKVIDSSRPVSMLFTRADKFWVVTHLVLVTLST